MKTIHQLKTIALVFFIFTAGNLVAQNLLGSSLKQVEEELGKLNINYNKNDEEKSSVTIVYKTNQETKIYEFKKNASNEFVCITEQSVLKFSETLLKQILIYLEALGYEETNFINYLDFPVAVSANNKNHKVKHYFHFLPMLDPNDNRQKLMIFEFDLNTDEFKINRE